MSRAITRSSRDTVRAMRVGVCVVLALAACGPTAVEIKTAKDARYDASAQDVYAQAEAETATTYEIGERLPDELIFATVPSWYSDNGRLSRDAEDAQKTAGNMQVSFVVVVSVEVTKTAVIVTPKVIDYTPGVAKPTDIGPNDPKLPAWITKRADELQVAIHKRIQAKLPPRTTTSAAPK